MKKSIVLLLIVFNGYLFLSAQTFITTYETSSGDLLIEASQPNESGNFNFYIQTLTWKNEKFKLIVSNKGLDSFKRFVAKSKEKFLKEKQYSESAGYEKLQKKLIESEDVFQGVFFITKWFYNESIKLQSTMSLYDEEYTLTIENVGEIIGERGQFKSTNKFAISFDDEEQIDLFLTALDESKTRKALSESIIEE